MEIKFKVGDIISRNTDPNDKFIIKSIGKYNNSYMVDKNGIEYRIHFSEEKNYNKVLNELTSIILPSCPQCNGELKDHYSEWAGKDIKKCKNCGWC